MFENAKYRITDRVHFRLVEKELMDRGYRWAGSLSPLPESDANGLIGLYTDSSGILTYSHDETFFNVERIGELEKSLPLTGVTKPPVGLRPTWVVETNRKNEILEAMRRYSEAGCQIPNAWFEELNQRIIGSSQR